ncbi:MAG TPA: serine/threonine-protein kinase [Pirellulales bacterium]|nr:serine/threonine-protein kinase [Pirellulales bacterium]
MSQRNRFFIPRADRRLGDRYELMECLGEGTHGTVWSAQRLEDSEIVAVKIPREQGAKNEDLAEGKRLIGLDAHPNVVRVYWMDRVPPEREWYVIEMEYFPSDTLARLLDEGDQGFVTSYARLLSLYLQVLDGVRYLHDLGMSHGDIKPQNVLIAGDRAKVTDFGSSVLPEDMYARTRENGGTILYSAPEVAGITLRGKNKEQVFKADIYSLGVLLYHLVTSRLPHDTLSQVARYAPFPRPREINSSVCPALEEVILRAMARDPNDRWTSVGELIRATEKARRAQLDYVAEKTHSVFKRAVADWSSDVVGYLEKSDYKSAENAARLEFEASGDAHAFLMMLNAAARDGRYFDCLKYLDENPRLVETPSTVQRDIKQLALKCCLETRNVDRAERLLNQMIAEEGETPDLLFKRASILGLQARFNEACEVLLQLNRDFPGRPAILRRLVTVYEQLRDLGKASAFLKAYRKKAEADEWAVEKSERFAALGYR